MSSTANVRTYTLQLEPLSEQRLADFAQAAGLDLGEALQTVLQLGLEAGEARTHARDEQLQDVVRELRGINVALHTIGPNTVAAALLLAHWTAKANGSIGEDEFIATYEDQANDQWRLLMARAGILPPGGAQLQLGGGV